MFLEGKITKSDKHNIQKKKLLKASLATLNKHEDIKREYKKKICFRLINLTFQPLNLFYFVSFVLIITYIYIKYFNFQKLLN